MTKTIKAKDDLPLRRFTYSDSDHCAHWKRYDKGHAELEIHTHANNPYLAFYASEYTQSGSGKRTMITMSAEQGREFFNWLKTVYEPNACPKCRDTDNQFDYGTHRECNACGYDSRED